MTTRLYAHASAAAALLLTAAACYPDRHPRWVALTTLLTAAVFAWLARRLYAQARREGGVLQRMERLKDDEARFELPPPCCPFWLHSDAEIHTPGCPRSTETAALTPAEEAAFAEIEAGLSLTYRKDGSTS